MPRPLQKVDEYNKFVAWMATPPNLRLPRTQGAFAKENHVQPQTLTDWKKRPDYWKQLKVMNREWGKEKMPEVMDAVFRKIKKEGTAQEAKFFAQYYQEFDADADKPIQLQVNVVNFGRKDKQIKQVEPVEETPVLQDNGNSQLNPAS